MSEYSPTAASNQVESGNAWTSLNATNLATQNSTYGATLNLDPEASSDTLILSFQPSEIPANVKGLGLRLVGVYDLLPLFFNVSISFVVNGIQGTPYEIGETISTDYTVSPQAWGLDFSQINSGVDVYIRLACSNVDFERYRLDTAKLIVETKAPVRPGSSWFKLEEDS